MSRILFPYIITKPGYQYNPLNMLVLEFSPTRKKMIINENNRSFENKFNSIFRITPIKRIVYLKTNKMSPGHPFI